MCRASNNYLSAFYSIFEQTDGLRIGTSRAPSSMRSRTPSKRFKVRFSKIVGFRKRRDDRISRLDDSAQRVAQFVRSYVNEVFL